MRNAAFSFPLLLGVRPSQLLLLTLATLSGVYVYICGRDFRSEHLAQVGTVDNLIRAARLQPGNAKLWQRLGIARLYQENDPETALSDFQHALQLNPRDADSWIGTAYALQSLGRLDEERAAISEALGVEPRRPEIAWQAANLYAVLGDREPMMKEVCTLLAYAPLRKDAALDLVSRTTHGEAPDCGSRKDTR